MQIKSLHKANIMNVFMFILQRRSYQKRSTGGVHMQQSIKSGNRSSFSCCFNRNMTSFLNHSNTEILFVCSLVFSVFTTAG